MEILAHTLWSTAGAKLANDISKEKNKKFKFNYFWTAFWGIFPDIFSLSIPFVVFAIDILIGKYHLGSLPEIRNIINSYDISLILYPYSHSFVIWILFFALIWVLKKKPPYAMLGWALHILLDIPSHSVGFFATPFLFPISDYRFPYGVSWATKGFFIVNYIVLFFVWSFVLFRNKIFKKRENKNI
jgi:hypothetical protein